ncbi:MAG: 16S rRNA (uracil(1498)-N(3))-methyltransferase, partial [Candidatus Woesearchaeota archaeon]
EEARHMKVRRLTKGNKVCLFDGQGNEALGTIEDIKEGEFLVHISDRQKVSYEGVFTTLATAVPKGKRMDWLVQKATELGAMVIIPIVSQRAVVKPKQGEKTERWEKIAIEAAKQSKRATIPKILPPADIDDILNEKYDLKLALMPESDVKIKEVLREKKPEKILCLIGPEGGFTDEEKNKIKAAGFTPVNIGENILRIETAGITVLAMIKYEYN